ncbi:hypothetical protein GVAV_003046 [Gurleya vavrai]
MYKVTNQVLINLANAYPDSENKKMTMRLVEMNKSISDCKHEMNKKLTRVLIYIKQLRNQSVEINDTRTKLRNAQYDADNAFESKKKKNINADPHNDPEVKPKIEAFNMLVEKSTKMMNEFMESPNHKQIIEGYADACKEYYADVYKSLK